MILPILPYRTSFPYQLFRPDKLITKITSAYSFDVACVGAEGSSVRTHPLARKSYELQSFHAKKQQQKEIQKTTQRSKTRRSPGKTSLLRRQLPQQVWKAKSWLKKKKKRLWKREHPSGPPQAYLRRLPYHPLPTVSAPEERVVRVRLGNTDKVEKMG